MRRFLLISCLSFVSAVLAAPLNERTSTTPTAKVRNGTLVGRNVPEYNEDFFLGIPYAQAPVGELRLANPVSLNSTFHGGSQEATDYYPSCVGYGSDQWGYPISEDCLALNVVRPEGTSEKDKLPVAVWIHGGGFSEGGSRDKRYNLSFIVKNSVEMGKPIIATSINYRLAQWGWLSSDEVQKAGVTNLGIKDQRLALHWLQENIAAFGGDPEKVTIWGESAGGASVGYHAILYGGRDDHLYRGIIGESYYSSAYETNTTAYNEYYEKVTSAAGCGSGAGSLECLRKVPYAKLNDAFNKTLEGQLSGPVIDGDLLTELSSVAMSSGKFTRTPTLIGCNTDEGTAFGQPGINTTQQFGAAVAAVGANPAGVAAIEKLYPDIPALGIPATEQGRPPAGSPLGQQWKRSAAFFGDYTMHSSRRAFNQIFSKYGVKSYSYRFNVRPNGLPDTVGVTHFQEVAFVFNNTLDDGLGYGEPISAKPFQGLPPKYFEMAVLMDRMWVSFIHDQDPNNHGISGTAHWPSYTECNPSQNFVFDVNVTSHAEDDTYRKDGIAYIIENAATQFHK